MPNSFYDDPRWKVSGGDRIKFEQIGDSASGRVAELKFVTMMSDQVPVAVLADVTARQAGQQVTFGTADLSLGLTHLARIWDNEQPAVGDLVEIVFTESKNVGQPQPQKRFSLTVTRAGQAQPVPADGTQGDLFG